MSQDPTYNGVQIRRVLVNGRALDGLTAGEIARRTEDVSETTVRRCLDRMVTNGQASVKRIPIDIGVRANVYSLTERGRAVSAHLRDMP